MMGKALTGKTLSSEFQVINPEEFTNKKKRLQVQEIIPYKSILKYLHTVEPT